MIDCSKCLKTKHERNYYKHKDCKTLYSVCKDCHREYQRKRRKDLPDYHRSRYLKKYGLTLEEYKQMLTNQNGLCAMCFSRQTRALSVDHNHESGKVRALLCGSCNALLGLARESNTILIAAIEYLQKHKICDKNTDNGDGDGATHRHAT